VSDPRGDLEAAFVGRRIVLIGAGALHSHGLLRGRMTEDLDFAIDVEVDELIRVAQGIDGWSRSERMAQRWHTAEGGIVDLVPMGARHLAEGHVEWPDGARMGLVGFRHLEAPVASPAAVVLLKLVALDDRGLLRLKDLVDIAWLCDDYVGPTEDRAFEGPAADRGWFAEEGSAWTLGHDLGRLAAADDERALVRRVLAEVLAPKGRWATRLAAHVPKSWGRDVDETRRRFGLLLDGFESA